MVTISGEVTLPITYIIYRLRNSDNTTNGEWWEECKNSDLEVGDVIRMRGSDGVPVLFTGREEAVVQISNDEYTVVEPIGYINTNVTTEVHNIGSLFMAQTSVGPYLEIQGLNYGND